jgi:hypothetical protein
LKAYAVSIGGHPKRFNGVYGAAAKMNGDKKKAKI